jgi:hypothetical protein
MQSYRNDLIGRQRALEQQGVSPGAEPYRTNQHAAEPAQRLVALTR